MSVDIILYSRRAIDLPEYAEKNFFGENCKIIYAKAEKYPGKVLNKALKKCQNAYVLITTADCVFEKDFEKNIDKFELEHPNFARAEMRTYPKEREYHYSPVTFQTEYVSASPTVFNREKLEKIGGFDENLTEFLGEDTSLGFKAAGEILYYLPFVKCSVTVDWNENQKYLNEVGSKLILSKKYKYKPGNREFWQEFKSPKSFPGVRKLLLKEYAKDSFAALKYTFKNNFKKIEYNPNFAPKRGDYPGEFVKEEPLVSVVVRTHKRKEVLRRTLKSLENQLYKNFEVIIVEDGENTAENMVKSDFPSLNINYFATGENVGRGRAGNIGIERAKGKYVCFLDDDDYYYADCISTFVAKLEKFPEVGFVVSGGMAYETEILNTDPYEFTVNKIYPISFSHITLMDMCVKCRIPMCCGMFRRELYDKVGGMREDIGGDEDWAMWLKFLSVSKRTDIAKPDIPKALSMFGYPRDMAVAKKREENYAVFDKIMLSDESIVFTVTKDEITLWQNTVKADVEHLKSIGAEKEYISTLPCLGCRNIEPTGDEISLTPKQINMYYHYLYNKYVNE